MKSANQKTFESVGWMARWSSKLIKCHTDLPFSSMWLNHFRPTSNRPVTFFTARVRREAKIRSVRIKQWWRARLFIITCPKVERGEDRDHDKSHDVTRAKARKDIRDERRSFEGDVGDNDVFVCRWHTAAHANGVHLEWCVHAGHSSVWLCLLSASDWTCALALATGRGTGSLLSSVQLLRANMNSLRSGT